MRLEHSSARIALLHVTAPPDEVIARAKRRGEITGRVVPQELLEKAINAVPGAVKALTPLVILLFQ